ncbi:MAG TPA: PEGA domain-containing protein [Kofleriaceae bacterium]|jgi:hypothetical protein
MRLFLACALAIAIPRIARGDGIGVIAISASQTDRGAVADAMVAAIAEQQPPRIVRDAVAQARGAVGAGAVPVEELARFRRVHDLIDEGWRAYSRVSFDFAQARLAAARTEAEGIVALPGGAELYADASLRLGIVLGALGNTAASQSAIALALALDPERPITLAEFSPDVVTAVGAVRALARPTREIAIAVEPAGATVAVDGKDLGAAPLHAQLAVGQHVVVARAPGYVARAQAIAVADGVPDVQLALDPDVAFSRLDGGARAGMPDAPAQELVDAAIRFAELDEVVVVADSDRMGGEALLVQRCAGLPARCTAVVELGYGDRAGLPAAARSAWQAVRAADLRYPPSVLGNSRVAGERVAAQHCTWCRSPWLWGGVGVAVIAGTIATIAIVSASKPAPIVSTNPGGFITR